MSGSPRIFDTHTHVGAARHSGRVCRAEDLLRSMDRHGIAKSMVIPFPSVDSQPAAHDEIGRAVLAYPDRLAGAVCLDPFLPADAFRQEIRRCVETYGFQAIKLQPQFQPLNVLHERSRGFFEAALEFRLPVIAHTGAGAPLALPSHFMLPAREFPELPIVLAHCGGGSYAGEAMVAALFCPNIYLELSTVLPHQILEILRRVPAGRLMIGSDLLENTAMEIGKILSLPIPEADRREILSGAADRLFPPR